MVLETISLRAFQKTLLVLHWGWKPHIKGYELFRFSVWHQCSSILAGLNSWRCAQCPFHHFPHPIHTQFLLILLTKCLSDLCTPIVSHSHNIFSVVRSTSFSLLNHCNKITQSILCIAAKMTLQNTHIWSWH